VKGPELWDDCRTCRTAVVEHAGRRCGDRGLPHRHCNARPGLPGPAAHRTWTRRCRNSGTRRTGGDDAATYCHEFFGYNFAGARPDGSSALSNVNERIHGHFFGQSSFATYALCHEANVVKVRDDVPLAGLAPLACGIQTGAGAVINVLRPGPGNSLAVFGTGSVGLSAIMAARMIGVSTIIGIDLNETRLALAHELGATHTIKATENVAEAINKITKFGVISASRPPRERRSFDRRSTALRRAAPAAS
jgi:Zn-dependent alcohol dehydrogenase